MSQPNVPALELTRISKQFGSVTALHEVDFSVAKGEVHGLLGENGAGKSTLMHVAYGLVRTDEGRIRINGAEVTVQSPSQAKQHGLGMVHQHFTSIPALTVEENLWLAAGRFGSSAGSPPSATELAIDQLRSRLWEGLDRRTLAGRLSVGGKQRLEILQALATGAQVLLLDEPTAVLTPSETESLMGLLRDFARGGGSVVLITHKLDEVFAAASSVTVLRAGAVVLRSRLTDETPATLARAMIGESTSAPVPNRGKIEPLGPVQISTPLLEVRAGEVVGMAAVEGNGQRELLRQLAGVEKRPPDFTVQEPVAFIPEDRTTEGLIPAFSLTENLVLALPRDPRWRDGPWLRWQRATARATELIGEFGIRAASAAVPVRTLSGGNQQKLVFARAVETGPKVVIAENPTRGLDFQATDFVLGRLRQMAAEGAAVVVYSADLDEVLAVADRVVVVRRGAVEPVPPGAPRAVVGSMMLGGSERGADQ